MNPAKKTELPKEQQHYYAQVYCLLTKNMARVQFQKGDTVGELLDLVYERWGISCKKGWFPVLVMKNSSIQLRLTDEIPIDIERFLNKVEREMVPGVYFREMMSGVHSSEAIGEKKRFFGENVKGEKKYSEIKKLHQDMDSKWDRGDIRIMIVTAITGG